ncbi:MAG: DNA-3-methyladenine glycosylase I [Elusimicrobia bacterium]|nr:DNA-3-methyladenine glycosylase I [Elusimicrobiota bacterium]
MSTHAPAKIKRCPWPANDELMLRYHDQEWGVPVYEDRKIFEYLILEAFQAGLSWKIVLYKRQNFRKAFANFDFNKVAGFAAREEARLVQDAGIIRNRAKISAAIHNASRFIEVRKEFGTFSKYMWSWVKENTIVHKLRTLQDYPVSIPEAEAWAKDMKARGFKFLGPTVVYAHMQAVGMVNDHAVDCFRRNSNV